MLKYNDKYSPLFQKCLNLHIPAPAPLVLCGQESLDIIILPRNLEPLMYCTALRSQIIHSLCSSKKMSSRFVHTQVLAQPQLDLNRIKGGSLNIKIKSPCCYSSTCDSCENANAFMETACGRCCRSKKLSPLLHSLLAQGEITGYSDIIHLKLRNSNSQNCL